MKRFQRPSMACARAARALRGVPRSSNGRMSSVSSEQVVGLHDDHAVDRMALDFAQELVGAALAIGLGPVLADEVAVVVGHQARIGVDDEPARRIVDARQLVERHEARPVELDRSSPAPASSRRPCGGSAPGPARSGRCSPRCRHRPCSASASRCAAPPPGIPPSSAPGRGGRSPRPTCPPRRVQSPAGPARAPVAAALRCGG